MAIKNNLIFICLLVLILLGVGCVSATPESGSEDTLKISDSNETVMADIDDAGLDKSISLDKNDEGDDIIGDGLNEGTFTDLQSKIDASSGVLNLSYGFTYNGDVDSGIADGVRINKNLVIDGNGNTVSGNNSVRIFLINKNCNVTLNNIAFVDGYCINNGGAIYSEGNLTVNDCTFTNCRDDYGCAIYNDDDGNLSLRGNIINDASIYNRGMITSPTTAVVLENRTHDVLTKTYDLTAGWLMITEMKFMILISGFL